MNQKSRVTKELNEKHRKILEGLLKLPENRECADCKSNGPRWASVNLGIFICMQCSGIHRSLGVHISKVRSATLDTWLPDQIAFIQTMGNKKSNSYWEAELPPKYNRVGIENFIRAKYEAKKWVSRERKVEPHSSEENIPVYKPGTTTITSTRAIALLPQPKQSPQLYNSNKNVPSKQGTIEPKQTKPKSKHEETKASATVSVQKVDNCPTDLFDNITETGSKTSLNDENPQKTIQTSPVTNDNDTKRSSNDVRIKTEFEDLFEGLDWVTPSVTQEPSKEVKNDIMNLFEKSTKASPFSVHQNQQAVHAQQQYRPVANHKDGVNGFHQALNHPRFSQMGNNKASPPIGNPGYYTTSSIYRTTLPAATTKNIGVSRPSVGQLSIPTQLGGEYDFSSLTQGMFTRR